LYRWPSLGGGFKQCRPKLFRSTDLTITPCSISEMIASHRLPAPEETVAVRNGLQRMLSRITSGENFIPALDGLRFLAIFAVVLYHLAGYVATKSPATSLAAAKTSLVYAVLDKGNCGVQLFFIISGFILALPFVEHFLAAKKPVCLRKYYRRRVTRLVPPYVCNLLIAYFDCRIYRRWLIVKGANKLRDFQ
jgi:hypothetical protein